MNWRLLLAVTVLTAALSASGCNDSDSAETASSAAAPAAPPASSADAAETPAKSAAAIDTVNAVEDSLPALAAAGETDAPPRTLRDYQQQLSRRCETDADCVVKNVGSCCGYTPQCVHKDVQTFPEQVKALCEQEGRSSICGFQEPAGCSCVDNQCRNSNTGAQ